MEQIFDILQNNAYPGRGILLGQTPDSTRAMIAYFIMGRSENSRNRVFVPDGAGLRTEAFDPAKLTDPSLIIYAPVRTLGGQTIVTNGDQTDMVHDALARRESFQAALRTRTFEPDGPNYTPRISGLLEANGGYTLSILKSAEGDPAACRRFFYEYDRPLPGQGHFIHTYQQDGDPLPSFVGEPRLVATMDDIEGFTQALWTSLNPDNKVALFVRYVTLATGETETRIQNRHEVTQCES
ncbi:MAG: IMP cyclohydrolase [Oscillospiraceae bacterium]|nr:IMP cyclohydrolase [Oscillospiraceae bacterium]